MSAFYGLAGDTLRWNDIDVLPCVQHGYGNESLIANAQVAFGEDPRAGTVLTLMDVWVIDPHVARQVNMACWCPVDHEPAPPMVRQFLDHSGAVPIAMSRFGERMLARWEPLYVPHGIDTDAIKPHPRDEARERVGLPTDRFIVGMVAANKGNPSRKSFPEAIEAFARFYKTHKDAILYLHTESTGRADGVPLPPLIESLGLPKTAVFWPSQHRLETTPPSDERMGDVFASMDVLLNPSRGEGFGIPVIEAQAAGTPVIVSDCTAMTELGQVGWRVSGQRYWTPQVSWQITPDVDQLVDSLTESYDMAGNQGLRRAAREHALAYDHRRVFEEHWIPTLQALNERFEAREPKALESVAA